MTRTLLIANPSLDVYGADLQMLETVSAARSAGWRVVVTSPSAGPLEQRLRALGAEPCVVEYPVLRRADATPLGILRFAWSVATALPRLVALLRRTRPDVVLVNTITLPVWTLVARVTGRRTVCHVHEAEDRDNRWVRKLMGVPVGLAHVVVMNSQVTLDSMCGVSPRLRRKARLIYNGITPPTESPSRPEGGRRTRLTVVGRLSSRKAPDVALEAAALLRQQSRDVEVELVGTPAPGMEPFALELEARAGQDDLAGAVTFTGYADPVWPAFARADIVVAPSLGESFGNVVVEAQMAMRPVVATGVLGHTETVEDGVTGLLVPVGDATSLAAAISRLLDDPALADELAAAGRESAMARFTSARYRSEMQALLNELSEPRSPRHSKR